MERPGKSRGDARAITCCRSVIKPSIGTFGATRNVVGRCTCIYDVRINPFANDMRTTTVEGNSAANDQSHRHRAARKIIRNSDIGKGSPCSVTARAVRAFSRSSIVNPASRSSANSRAVLEGKSMRQYGASHATRLRTHRDQTQSTFAETLSFRTPEDGMNHNKLWCTSTLTSDSTALIGETSAIARAHSCRQGAKYRSDERMDSSVGPIYSLF